MPKLACPCGFIHDLSPIPDEGWITVRDRDFDAMIEAELGSRRSLSPEHDVEAFWGSMYECPKCSRIMWEKPGEKRFTIYRRDE